MKLTERQREVLDTLGRFITEHGMPPTVRELGVLVGVTSTNGVIDHLRALERKGYVRHAKGLSRSWRPR